MKKEDFLNLLKQATEEFKGKKKQPTTPAKQFEKGAMWLWNLLYDTHEVIYYEDVLRRELIDRIGEVEAWKESLITDTAMMMADRDGMMTDILETGRLIERFNAKAGAYEKVSNPLYVHKKELDRSIGMQREHLGLSNKVNPKRITENAKKGVDSEKDGLMSRIDEVKDTMNDVPDEM